MAKIDVSSAKGWKPTPRGSGNSSGLLGFCGYVHLGRPEKVEAKQSKDGGRNNKYLEFTFFPQDDDCQGTKIVDRTTITGTMQRGDNAGTPNITMLFEQLHKAGMSQAEINSKIGSKGGMDEVTLAKACAKRDYYAFVGVDEFPKGKWKSDVKFYVTKDDYEDAIANDTARESLPPEAQEFYDRKAAGGGFRTTESADAGDVEDDDDF